MPVLKTYTNGSGHYIHASIHGAVVTFQTTKPGVEKLMAAGIQPGARFGLRLLADLTRTGDAYTHHGGVEYYEAEQFQFDFSESKESETLFPVCAVTGQFDDLHLVAHDVGDGMRVELLAPSARFALPDVRISVPISILSPEALTILETTEQIVTGTDAVSALRRWYAQNASAEWERMRRDQGIRQEGLPLEKPDELKF